MYDPPLHFSNHKWVRYVSTRKGGGGCWGRGAGVMKVNPGESRADVAHVRA